MIGSSNQLKCVIGKAKSTHDELVTMLVEVEAYLSSEDPGEPLTPSHLLICRTSFNDT